MFASWKREYNVEIRVHKVMRSTHYKIELYHDCFSQEQTLVSLVATITGEIRMIVQCHLQLFAVVVQ